MGGGVGGDDGFKAKEEYLDFSKEPEYESKENNYSGKEGWDDMVGEE